METLGKLLLALILVPTLYVGGGLVIQFGWNHPAVGLPVLIVVLGVVLTALEPATRLTGDQWVWWNRINRALDNDGDD